MEDPLNPLSASSGELPLWQLPKDVFEERLGHVLDTYYLGILQPPAITGDSFDSNIGSQGTGEFAPAVNVGGNVTTLREIYVCDWAWLVFYFLASFAMLIAGITGVVVGHLTLNPDVLGFASSLTRDNPYVRLPPGGSTLYGYERARLLRNLNVR